MLFEMVSVSIVLAHERLFDYSLYICLGVIVLMTVLTLIIAPYNTTFDNMRLLIHRLLLITVCCLQIGFKILRTDEAPESSIVYVYPWIIIAILMIEALVGGIPYMIFKAVMWIKSRDLVDVALYNKQKKVDSRPFYPNISINPPILYPALEFSRFRNRDERDENERQKLLNV